VYAANAIRFFAIAFEFNFDTLMKDCSEYIRKTIKFIPKTQWHALIAHKPPTFNEIFKHCIAKNGHKLKSFYGKPQYRQSTQVNSSDSDCLRDFEEMLNRQLFADVDLEVDGKILKAHKAVLSSIV
jgi:hypothetical protein